MFNGMLKVRSQKKKYRHKINIKHILFLLATALIKH